ncbi:DUF4381 domain-containing protein [Vibrio cincinnatiensis]|jgi:hypothetical protein|uniref:DUF4381 domain-containing protein n=1 Tax=Vibrio cincinnatiensis DSM 19608 TaxID=1123491 RepID=A0A1T4Q435_VIBCI|nr:DUF4381 domain-containing protein [Vibrio cincinnatiensis]MCG3721055.1 DUF4381 domain-containing protein [Vibrio cincinnatiensis]MCG3726613.1 DUF4381 domain-containing protein [Vibrio cincinnatiensis]MCG3732334.1 DUF4381 domain-containing protein [Vibrio cincinnatiensis]MCG3737048.1 DUF4381 domain-containing protein [Vibrio cincinnatiensis]MCG3738953.1 DUF4381 domain-containing protein [Vibrio cincinnatiensis]
MQELSASLNLNALHLPDLPSWWPLAWGWWISLAVVLLLTLLILCLAIWKRKRLAPKKTALRLLTQSNGYQTPSAAMELLRQVALCYYPRDYIAPLTGHEWYAFLDNQLGQSRFVPNVTLWQQALYQKTPITHPEQLISDCQLWINEALPPKKRSLRNLGKH